MLTGNRPGPGNNPLVDSPYFDQYNLSPAFNPITGLDFLLLDGDGFYLLDGDKFELLGA